MNGWRRDWGLWARIGGGREGEVGSGCLCIDLV
jgi:hypothetical protein